VLESARLCACKRSALAARLACGAKRTQSVEERVRGLDGTKAGIACAGGDARGAYAGSKLVGGAGRAFLAEVGEQALLVEAGG
jgi:hypothetical protein